MEAVLEPILAGCRRGDSKAQRQLFDRYKSPLFSICLRYACDRPEAQDLLQEAFLVIFRDLHQYRGDGPFDGWLRRLTVRTALQALRRKNPLRNAEEYDQLALISDLPTDTELNGEAILLLVQRLPPGYRTVFNLRCLEEYSYTDIAADLGLSESGVRSQYARACKQLRSMIERLLVVI